MLAALIAVIEHSPNPFFVLVYVFLREGVFFQQFVNVFVKLWNLLLNAFIHERLSERGLVSLIVSLLAITNNVDNDVFPELSAPVGSHLTDEIDSLHIITIHMDDGSVDCFGDIRAVRRRSSKARISGEPNLVVNHNVN